MKLGFTRSLAYIRVIRYFRCVRVVKIYFLIPFNPTYNEDYLVGDRR